MSFPSDPHPPTASSCPFSVTQVERVTGRSVIVCHDKVTLFLASDKVFLFFASAVCDWRRALREQLRTTFV